MWNVTISTLLTIILVVAFIAIFFLVVIYMTPAKSWVDGVIGFVQSIGGLVDFLNPGA